MEKMRSRWRKRGSTRKSRSFCAARARNPRADVGGTRKFDGGAEPFDKLRVLQQALAPTNRVRFVARYSAAILRAAPALARHAQRATRELTTRQSQQALQRR